MNRLLLSLAALTLIYALAVASFHPWDLAFGLGASALVLLLFRAFLFGERLCSIDGLGARALALLPFVWRILVDMTVGTWRVASVVLHLRPLESPGIVAVPLGERSAAGAVVSAFAATLSPGEYLVEIDWERRRLLMHVLDARDPEAVRKHFETFYDRYQRRVVP
ncbi:MAG TPA: Na+/H+ antiporter subunit E [Gaiellaceae bacterium]|nr:Na+/H+ antiporter subunit E [Gaiellaceae bacterium]